MRRVWAWRAPGGDGQGPFSGLCRRDAADLAGDGLSVWPPGRAGGDGLESRPLRVAPDFVRGRGRIELCDGGLPGRSHPARGRTSAHTRARGGGAATGALERWRIRGSGGSLRMQLAVTVSSY